MNVFSVVLALAFPVSVAPQPDDTERAAVCMSADSASPAFSSAIAALLAKAGNPRAGTDNPLPRVARADVRLTTEQSVCVQAVAAADAMQAEPVAERAIYVFRVSSRHYAVVDVLRRSVGDYDFSRGVILFFDNSWRLLDAVMM